MVDRCYTKQTITEKIENSIKITKLTVYCLRRDGKSSNPPGTSLWIISFVFTSQDNSSFNESTNTVILGKMISNLFIRLSVSFRAPSHRCRIEVVSFSSTSDNSREASLSLLVSSLDESKSSRMA